MSEERMKMKDCEDLKIVCMYVCMYIDNQTVEKKV